MDTPFIKTLRSPNGHYCYDVNTNSIVRISKHLYSALNESWTVDELISDSRTQSEAKLLISQGLLSSHRVSNIRHPYTDDLKYYLNNKIDQMTLQLTQNCNLRCSYCPYTRMNKQQRGFSSNTMTKEIGEMAIDFLREHSSDNEKVTIGFYGGEPLINFKLIQHLTQYAKSALLGKKVSYTITTNGTLLTPRILKFLHENDCSLLLSIDGPENIQNKNRFFANGKGSFARVYENLRKLRMSFGSELSHMISINMVMDPSNDFDQINHLFADPLFKDIPIQAVLLDDEFSDHKNKVSRDFLDKYIYQEALASLSFLDVVEDLQVSPIFLTFLGKLKGTEQQMRGKRSKLPDVGAPAGPCIPGQRRLFVDYRGNLFPCERVSETSACMRIGNLSSGFNYVAAERLLNVATLIADRCKDCFAFNSCISCCKVADDNGSLSAEKLLKGCAMSKEIVLQDLEESVLIKEAYSVYGKSKRYGN